MEELSAALIAAAVSLLVSALTNLWDRSRFFSKTVSGERIAWIREMRDLSAKMLSICERYTQDNLPDEKLDAFLETRNGILIRLNPIDTNYPHDQKLQHLLAEPDFASVKANVPEIRYELGTVLKTEWEKVKVEAGNNMSKIRQVDKERGRISRQRAERTPD